MLWQTTLNVANGYGMSARAIVRALQRDGVECTLAPLEKTRGALVVTYATGDCFALNRGRRRIGFTMTEVDGVPAEWVRGANRLDEIWTPTEFNRRALLEGGVDKSVYLIPLGIDPEAFRPDGLSIRNPCGDFVFLAHLEWSERKNPQMVLRAFDRTFAANESAILVCKINNRDPHVDIDNEIRALGLRARIHFIHNREVPHEQLAILYRSADCFVTASRGEGWGLPLLEAMSCGLPAIATDWGGHTAFLDAKDTYPLRVQSLVPAGRAWSAYDGFRWAEPDEDHLCELLRYVFTHQEEARKRGLHAAARVRETLTWAHTARAIRARL